MPRFKLIMEYDGAPFVGWQRQQNGPSVQEALEQALFAMTGEQVAAHGAGRTDAGVHALGQTAHVDLGATGTSSGSARPSTPTAAPPDRGAPGRARRRRLRRALQRQRPPLSLPHRQPPGAARPRPRPRLAGEAALDAMAMHAAAGALVGRHDFSTFRDSQCQAKSPLRTLDAFDVRRTGDEVRIEASALSFLHRQVRSMVGSLVEVGTGRWSSADLKAALDAADRSRCGQVAPACGLYLARVDYGAPAAENEGQADGGSG